MAEKGFTVPISWTDVLGLEGEAGFEVRVDSLPDQAPGIYIQGLPRQLEQGLSGGAAAS